MSKLQLSVDLSLNDKLSQALEKAIKPAQQLSDQFDDLKKSVEKFKLPDIDTSAFDKLKDEAQGVIEETQRLSDELKKLDKLKLKLERFEKIKQDTQEANTALNQHKKAIEALKAQMASGGGDSAIKKQLSELEKEAKKLQNTVERNTPTLKKMRQELNDVGLGGMNLSEAQAKIAADIKKTEVAIESQQGTLNRINNAYGNHADAVAKAKSAQEKYEKQIEETGKKIERQQAIIEKAQKAREYAMEALRVAGSVAGAAGMAVKAYADSQDAETTLKISMMGSDGKVAKEYKDIVKLAEKMGTKLPGTTADFKQMMAVLVQQGISFQSILGGVGESAGNLAVLLKMPFDQAAEFAAKLQDATKTTEKDMMSLMDTIQKMYYLGADSTNILAGFKNLSSSMSVIGKQGKEYVDTVAPLLVMADQASMDGSSAGNAYRKIFQSMMDTEGFNKALRSQGINTKFDFTDGKGEFGGFEKMFAQLSQLKGIATDKRIKILEAAFGNDSEVATALNLMIDKGQAGYDEVVAKMARQADINKRVQAQLGTLRNLWDAASGTATSLMARAGEALAPWVESLTKWLTTLGEKISAWIDRNPELFNGLVKFGAVLAGVITIIAALVVIVSSVIIPLAALKMSFLAMGGSLGAIGKAFAAFGGGIAKIGTLLFGGLVKGLGLLLTGFGKLGGLMLTGIKGIPAVLGLLKGGFIAAAGAVKSFGLALLANPMGLVIGALVVGAVLIYKYWGPVKDFLAGLWDGFSAGFAPVMGILDSFFGALGQIADALGLTTGQMTEGSAAARQWGEVIGGTVAQVLVACIAPLRALVEMFAWAVDSITGLLSGDLGWSDVGSRFMDKLSMFGDGISGWLQKNGELWDKATGKISSTEITLPQPKMADGGENPFASLSTSLEAEKSKIDTAAGTMMQGVETQFGAATPRLTAKADEMMSAVADKVRAGDGDIASTVEAQMAQSISGINTATQTMGAQLAGLLNTFGVAMAAIPTIASTAFSALPAITSIIFNSLVTIVAGSMISVINVISTTMSAVPMIAATTFGALPVIVATAVSSLPAIIAAALSSLPAMMAGVFATLGAATLVGMMSVTRAVTTGMVQVVNAVRTGFGRVRATISSMWRSMGSAMSGNPILSRLQAAMNQALGYLNGVKGRFAAIGADISAGLARGIQSNIGQVQAAAAQLARAAESAARVASDTHSPSRKMMAVGGDMVAGLDVGLRQGFAPTLKNWTANIGTLHQPISTPPIRATRPIMRGGGTGISHSYTGGAINITINAPAGSDQRSIAREVANELKKYERAQAAKRRASFSDYE